jgi:hypothetical protein
MTHNSTTLHRFPENTAFHSGENRFVHVAENPENAEIKRADGFTARLAILAILAGCFGVGVVGRDCDQTSEPSASVTGSPQPIVMKNVDNVSRRQQTAINIDGAINGANAKRLKESGISLPKWMYDESGTGSPHKKDIDSFLICLDGAGCDEFGQFRGRVMDMLQPKETACAHETPDLCEKIRERNAALILSLSAIGAYQILLFHHGEDLKGWATIDKDDWQKTDWPNNLTAIFNFLNNIDAQKDLADKVITKYLKKSEGKVFDAASRYYSGNKQGILSYSFQKLKRGVKNVFSLLVGAGTGKANYKLPREYADGVLDCFKGKTGGEKVADGTQEHLDIMRACVFGRETGGKGKQFKGRKSSAYDELIIRWRNRGVTIDPEVEKRWRDLGSLPDTDKADQKTNPSNTADEKDLHVLQSININNGYIKQRDKLLILGYYLEDVIVKISAKNASLKIETLTAPQVCDLAGKLELTPAEKKSVELLRKGLNHGIDKKFGADTAWQYVLERAKNKAKHRR